MFIRNLRNVCAAVLVGSFASAASAATVLIDDFSGASQIVTAPSLTPPNNNPDFEFAVAPSAIGGVRGIGAARTSPTGTNIGAGLITLGFSDGGVGGVSNALGAEGFATFLWQAGGADLVDGTNTKISIDVQQVTGPTGPALATFSLQIGGVSVDQLAAGAGTLEYNFSDFAGVDFTNVGDILLLVTGTSGFGTTFDNVQAVGGLSAVPLPAGGVLLLSGLGVMGVMRKRRKSQA